MDLCSNWDLGFSKLFSRKVKSIKRQTKKIPELDPGDFVYFERKLTTYFKGLNSKVTTPRVADFTSKDLVAKKENPLSFL